MKDVVKSEQKQQTEAMVIEEIKKPAAILATKTTGRSLNVKYTRNNADLQSE